MSWRHNDLVHRFRLSIVGNEGGDGDINAPDLSSIKKLGAIGDSYFTGIGAGERY